jgi:hypothetical protein
MGVVKGRYGENSFLFHGVLFGMTLSRGKTGCLDQSECGIYLTSASTGANANIIGIASVHRHFVSLLSYGSCASF